MIVEDDRGKMRASKVRFLAGERVIVAEGNVILVTKDGVRVECGRLEGHEGDIFKATDSPVVRMKNSILRAREMVLKGRDAEIDSPDYEDKENSLNIMASKASVTFFESGEVKTIKALGKLFVRHVKGKSVFTAKGDEGIYDVPSGLIRVWGDASATKDKTELRADEIIYEISSGGYEKPSVKRR